MGLARLENAPNQAAVTTRDELTHTGTMMGTIDYMSPEQALDTKHADARSDIYSLGCSLFFLLIGRAPYNGDTIMKKLLEHREAAIPPLSQLRNDVPLQVDALFRKMVAKNPDDRYQSMAELLAALEGIIGMDSAKNNSSLPTGVIEDSQLLSFLQGLDRDTNSAKPRSKTNTKLKTKTKKNTAAAEHTVTDQSLHPTHVSVELKQRKPRAAAKPRFDLRSSKMLPATGIALTLLLGFVGLYLAGVIFKVETPGGTVVLEFDQADMNGAEVFIDGNKKITIKIAPGKQPVEITVDKTKGKLQVKKGGFKTFTEQFTLTDDKTSIKVHLEPLPATLFAVDRFQFSEDIRIPRNSPTKVNDTGKDYALSFDGIATIECSPTFLYDGSHPLTMEARISFDGEFPRDYLHSIMLLGPGSFTSLQLQHKGTFMTYVRTSPDTFVSTVASGFLKRNQNVHVASVYDGKTLSLYVDGALQNERIPAVSWKRKNAHIVFFGALQTGKKRNVSTFRLTMDEVRFSNVARYTKNFTPAKRFKPDEQTMALYHFDEGTGDVLVDSSGNGHHGKIVGAKWINADGSAIQPK